MAGMFLLVEEPWLLTDLSSIDGWFIAKEVLPKVYKDGHKFLNVVRSYEFALKTQFHPETTLGAIAYKQQEFHKLFAKRQKAQAAARTK